MNLKYLNTKKLFQIFIALFAALIIADSFSFAEKIWIPLVVIFFQTANLFSLGQGLRAYFILIISISLASFITFHSNNIIINYAMLLTYIICGNTFLKQNNILINFMILITLILPIKSNIEIIHRISDVTIGAFIGILFNILIFPRKIDAAFRHSITPIFKTSTIYLLNIKNLFLKKYFAEHKASLLEKNLEYVMLNESINFPSSLYENGINNLQKGYRDFFILLNRMIEILFVMHYLASQQYAKNTINQLQKSFRLFIYQTCIILKSLIKVFNLQKISKPPEDLENALIEFEKALKNILPTSFELIDLSAEYLFLTALFINMQDMHATLIKIANLLTPSKTQESI